MRKLFVLSLILLLSGCEGKDINIPGFNKAAWKNDPFGCKNQRVEQVDLLLNNEEEILGLNSSEIIELLGNPDQVELYTRNQKFNHYFVTPGKQCDQDQKEHAKRLTLRFNALGMVNEITLYH